MIPASIRNRNSGAMYPGPSAKKFGSTSYETLKSKDGVHKIATFPTHVHGAAAHFDLLASKYTGMTLQKAIERWCGGYYASTYLKVLKDRAGVDENTVLTKAMLADHEIAIPIAKAMAWQEAGQDYPLKDEEWLEAHQMAMGTGTSAPEWNPRNDVPTPKPETRQAEAVKAVVSHPATVVTTVGGAATTVATVKQVSLDVRQIGSEVVSAFMLTGKLWPYVLAAGGAGAVLAFLAWRRRETS